MTRRERKERRLEQRRAWAEKAHAQADAKASQANAIGERFSGGQPILRGHHSEARALRDRDRMDAAMRGSFEAADLAKHHEETAKGIERQLKATIFSDDPDAIDALEAKVAELEEKRDEMKRRNAAFRKGGIAGLTAMGMTLDSIANLLAKAALTADKVPHPPYQLTNLGAEIRRARSRVDEIRGRQAQQAQAHAAGGILVELRGDQAVLTFSEPPGRSVTERLRAAGFRWSAPSWYGLAGAMPKDIGP